MSGSKRRRREARRKARERREQRVEEPLAQDEVAPAEAAEPRRVESRRQEPVRKKRKRGGGGLRIRLSPWLVAAPVAAAGIAIVAVLVLSSGSSSPTVGSAGEPTPDPRVAGLTPDVTIEIEAGGAANDAFFSPSTVTANAGDVIEFVVTNTGSVSHNMRVSGPNKEYDVDITGEKGDDFEMPPNVIMPGETQRLLVKIDEPGSYPFRCDFHPLVQMGTLVLR